MGIGFAVLGLPSAIVLGVVAAFLVLLPVGGAAMALVPAIAVLVSMSQWPSAISLAIWGMGVSAPENLDPALCNPSFSAGVCDGCMGPLMEDARGARDPDSRPWREDWRRLRQLLLNPTVDDQAPESALRSARARQPVPVVWLLGKAEGYYFALKPITKAI